VHCCCVHPRLNPFIEPKLTKKMPKAWQHPGLSIKK
jgi:hypothetical protein